jgi:DNA-binding transcriptional LysR family regulator
MPTLAQLQTFLAIHRAGSLTAAAQQLHLSQPAVSKHLKALETEAGRPMFVRLARGVAVTQEGAALARDIAPHLDALIAQAAKLSSRSAGATVHLAGPADMLASCALPSLAPLVAAGVRLRVRTGIAEGLLALLAADEIDLVIATRRIETPGLTFEPLFGESLVLIGNPAWAARLPADIIDRDPHAALACVPLVAFDEDLPLLRPYWDIAFGHTVEATAALTVADLGAVCSAVAAGAGISVVPRYLAATAIAHGELVELHVPQRPITNPIYLAYRRSTLRRPGVDDVRNILTTSAAGWEPSRKRTR